MVLTSIILKGKVTAENNGTMTKQKVERNQEKQSKETVTL